MLFLARKNLFQEKMRLIISIGGVAFSVMLMVLLQALSVGYSNVLGQYFATIPADLWVAKANTGNIMDPSFLPSSMGMQLTNIAGVASAKPFYMQSLTTGVRGKDLALYAIAYDASNSVGKPNHVSQGNQVPGKGEIVLDRITAKANHIKLGDLIPFGQRQLKVTGYSEGTYLLSSSFAFVNLDDARAIYVLPATTNYWLVQLKPNANTLAVQSAINKQLLGANAHTKAHFVQVNVDAVKSIVQPVFGSLVVLGAFIGIAVIGQTIYTSTTEKAKEYGVLKAIGLKNSQLYVIVLEQALTTAIIGYVVGALLVYSLSPLLTSAVPQFVIQIQIVDLTWIFGVTIGMAVVSSYIPMRHVSKIDPAEVFKS